jgi:hypothetical protein
MKDYSEIVVETNRMFKSLYNHMIKGEWDDVAKLANTMSKSISDLESIANDRTKQ